MIGNKVRHRVRQVRLSKFQYIYLCWKETTRLKKKKEKEKNIFRGMQAAAMAAQPVIKVAGLCGSLRKGSYNRGLLNAGKLYFFLFI